MCPRHPRVTALAAAVVAVVAATALAGCNTERGSAPADTLAVGNTVGSPQLSDSDAPTPPLPEPGETDSVPTTLPDTTKLGTCTVDVVGDLSDSWKTATNDEAFTYGGWFSDITRAEAATNSIVIDDGYFLLTCRASGDRSIGFAGNVAIAQRTTTYRLALNGNNEPSGRNAIAAVLALEPHGVCVLAGEGSLAIEAFDDAHIAGSFGVPFVCPDGSAVSATGRFAFSRPEQPVVPVVSTTP